MKYKQYCQLVMLIVLTCCYELKAQVLQTPDWELLSDMEYLGGILKPSSGVAPTTWCRAGSKSKLEKNEYGYIIVKSLGTTGDQYIGFSEVPYQYRNQESKYSLRFTSWGQIYLFVDGSSQGKIFPPTGSTNLEDYEVKLAKESDAIRIYVKGPLDGSFSLVKEHPVSSSYMPMWVYSNMLGNASGFEQMETNIPNEHHPVFWNLRETAGPTNNYGQARTFGDWKGGGVLSTQKLLPGKQGAISYEVKYAETSSYWIGFSSANGLDRSDQIDYGFEFAPGSILKAYCNGVLVDQSNYAVGSSRKARVIINQGQVDFYYGNTALYSQAISDPNLEFRVGLLFGNSGQSFDNIKTSLTFDIPEWDYENGVNFTEGGINVFNTNVTTGWNSSFASTAISTAREKNVYLEAISTDRFAKFIGIPFDHTDMNHISDFRHGFLVRNDGTKVTIYSTDDGGTTTSTLFDIADPDGDGNSVTNSSYYIYGNKMGIRVSETKIYFYYNNVLVHDEDFQHNYELHFGGMLFEENSGFRLLRYGIEEAFEEAKAPNWDYVKGLDRYLDFGLIKGENASVGLDNSISVSENVLIEGEYTKILFSGVSGNGIKRFGITNGVLPGSSGNIEHYFEVDDSQQLIFQDYGATITNLGQIEPEDIFSIENRDDKIYFHKNGRYLFALRAHATGDSYRLFTQLENENAKIESITISANGTPEIANWNDNDEYEYDSTTQLLTTVLSPSGGLSSNWVLAEGASGLVSWNNITGNDDYYAGFSHKKKPNNLEDLDFSYKVHDDGALDVYEFGVFKETILSAGPVIVGLLEVERRNDRILYLWNDIVVYESDLVSTDKLYPSVFGTELSQSLPQIMYSVDESPAKWIDKTNLVYDADFKNMICTSSDISWTDGGAATSANRLKTGETSYVSFRAGIQSGKYKAIALTAITDVVLQDPLFKDYVFYLDDDKVRIVENGITQYTGPSNGFNEGDLFSINKVNIGSGNYAIRYKQNDVVLRNSIMSSDIELMSTAQLVGDSAALYDINVGFKNIALPSTGSSPYMEMARTATAVYQKSEGQLLFKLDESFVYKSSDELNYTIYNTSQQELSCYGAPELDHLGGRRFVLDTSSFCTGATGLENGKYYTLEVTNKKNERRYMRFKYVIPI